MKTLPITDETFEKDVLRGRGLIIVDFWAEWCGPCRIIAPLLESVGEQFDGRLKVTKLNVDDNLATAKAFGIHGIPTLLFFKDGKLLDRLVGLVPRGQLVARIDRLLPGASGKIAA